MFCCDCPFLFPHSFCSLVHKLDIYYVFSVVNASTLVKPYSFMTFVNVGNGITGIEPVLINFMMSSGCLKFASKWVMIDSLNLTNWKFYLLSVGDSNNFKLSLATVQLLLCCWTNCLLLPLLFWFWLLVWRLLSPFLWLVSLPPWFTVTWSFPPGVDVWIFVCVSLFSSIGFQFLYWPHLKKRSNTF